MGKRKILLQSLFFLILLNSCSLNRKLTYFSDDSQKELAYNNSQEVRAIKPFDQLYIQVLSTDKQTMEIFNSTRSDFMNESTIDVISYNVDQSGDIIFPFVGKINLLNKSLITAKLLVEEKLSEYIRNVSVTIKFVNNSITVVGEANRPGNYTYTRDKIIVFDALAMAGGLTEYGRKDNITLIRDNNLGEIKYYTLDLTKKDIVDSDEYYLQSGDVIVINRVKQVTKSIRDYRLASLIMTSLSTLILIMNFIQNN